MDTPQVDRRSAIRDRLGPSEPDASVPCRRNVPDPGVVVRQDKGSGRVGLGVFPDQISPAGAGKIHDGNSGESGRGAPDQMDAILVIEADSGADEDTALFQRRFQRI